MAKLEAKSFVQSKTIMGAVVMLAGFLVKQYGLPITDVEVSDLVSVLVELAGLALTIYGRIKARQPISL